jgi:hypothetical protein
MKTRSLLALVLLALPFAALPASAACEVVTADQYPDINYTTVCLLDQGSYGDPSQTFDHAYVAHVSHAVEADPAFDYVHANADQGAWSYDDGFSQQQRQWTDVGAGAFEGVRGVAGTGVQADLSQRDQTVPEDEGNACSSVVGRSTCAGASGWLTVQDVASVGAGAYYRQSGTGADCSESYEVDVDAVVTFVPVTAGPQSCTTELPFLYDAVPFRDLPVLA